MSNTGCDGAMASGQRVSSSPPLARATRRASPATPWTGWRRQKPARFTRMSHVARSVSRASTRPAASASTASSPSSTPCAAVKRRRRRNRPGASSTSSVASSSDQVPQDSSRMGAERPRTASVPFQHRRRRLPPSSRKLRSPSRTSRAGGTGSAVPNRIMLSSWAMLPSPAPSATLGLRRPARQGRSRATSGHGHQGPQSQPRHLK
jgi:hypothetical protein